MLLWTKKIMNTYIFSCINKIYILISIKYELKKKINNFPKKCVVFELIHLGTFIL